VLTGGFGSADLILGPAAATFAQYFLETFGSTYFNDKRRRFVDLQAAKLDRIVQSVLLGPFEKVLPGDRAGVGIQEIAAGLESLEGQWK
ncbi:MAG: hypothetical protein ACYS47_09430, partial [Planctomycetota bacterium]|jgi:hypothetical protein